MELIDIILINVGDDESALVRPSDYCWRHQAVSSLIASDILPK